MIIDSFGLPDAVREWIIHLVIEQLEEMSS